MSEACPVATTTCDVIVLDTNILIRIITKDDPTTSERARRLVSENDVFVGVTVLLEAAWVLASRYRMAPRAVVEVLRGFVGLVNVSVEAPAEVSRALGWTEEGVDIADAFHLAFSGAHGPFATFDRELIRFAEGRGLAVVEP